MIRSMSLSFNLRFNLITTSFHMSIKSSSSLESLSTDMEDI